MPQQSPQDQGNLIILCLFWCLFEPSFLCLSASLSFYVVYGHVVVLLILSISCLVACVTQYTLIFRVCICSIWVLFLTQINDVQCDSKWLLHLQCCLHLHLQHVADVLIQTNLLKCFVVHPHASTVRSWSYKYVKFKPCSGGGNRWNSNNYSTTVLNIFFFTFRKKCFLKM